MAPTLYMFHGSPPVRSVLVTAKAIGLDLDIRELSYLNGDLFKPEFLKMNPQHTVPTLVDNGHVIWDSHAINVYLVEQYSKDDSLYPKDSYKRALINQRLHFDSGVLFPVFKSIIVPMLRRKANQIPTEKIKEVEEAYGFLEKFLEGHRWIVGDDLTIADFSCITIMTCLIILIPLDSEMHTNVINWMKHVQALPYFDSDDKELGVFRKFYERVEASRT